MPVTSPVQLVSEAGQGGFGHVPDIPGAYSLVGEKRYTGHFHLITLLYVCVCVLYVLYVYTHMSTCVYMHVCGLHV